MVKLLFFFFFLKMLSLHVSFERNLKVSLTALQNECLAPGELLPLLREPNVPPPTPTMTVNSG